MVLEAGALVLDLYGCLGHGPRSYGQCAGAMGRTDHPNPTSSTIITMKPPMLL
jgi:hypothetical protein